MVTETVKPKTDESFFADILAAIDFWQCQPEVLRERQSENLAQILNQMIERGAWFDVSADDFKVINADQLCQSDKDFLSVNGAAVLCTLKQSLLTKHLFSHRKDLLSDFAFEIAERESHLTENGTLSIEAHFEAVTTTTRIWFERLLEGVKK